MSGHLPLRSFWIGGFESACHINRAGCRLDLAAATQHDRFADADYRLLVSEEMRVSREAVPWHRVDSGGRYDFSCIEPLLGAAASNGVQVIWSLCHWGWPDGLDPLAPAFVPRMARYARAAAAFIAERSEGPHCFTPVNEISFAAWASGDVAYMHPFLQDASDAVKRRLVQAAIAASDEILTLLPDARLLHTDPIIQVVPPRGRPDLAAEAERYTESQFQAWDMLAGLAAPELGGHLRYLDALGANFYAANQWELGGESLAWDAGPRDDRWVPLSRQLARLSERYGRPVLIGETSHVGQGRADWLRDVTDEVVLAAEEGTTVDGICLYPVLDRPDWENPSHWHRSGLWDLEPGPGGALQRVGHQPYLGEFRRSRNRLGYLAAVGS